MEERALAFDPDASRYGLPPPRGVLLVGVQGCGKSLAAKAAAARLGVPILRLDLPRVLGGGAAAEERLALALEAAEALAPVALWVDEIEKGFAGSSPGDGGDPRAARLLGAFSTWLQERKGPVFVVATANDVSRLPPELLRRGRFDELFFVDLPDAEARREILALHLRRRGRDARADRRGRHRRSLRRVLRRRARAGGRGRAPPRVRARARGGDAAISGAWRRTWCRSSGPTRSRSRPARVGPRTGAGGGPDGRGGGPVPPDAGAGRGVGEAAARVGIGAG